MTQRIEIDEEGDKFYYNDKDQLHREDGPAYISAGGTKEWYINGALHREDGPAVTWLGLAQSWYINGEQLSEEEFNRHTFTPCKCPDYLQ